MAARIRLVKLPRLNGMSKFPWITTDPPKRFVLQPILDVVSRNDPALVVGQRPSIIAGGPSSSEADLQSPSIVVSPLKVATARFRQAYSKFLGELLLGGLLGKSKDELSSELGVGALKTLDLFLYMLNTNNIQSINIKDFINKYELGNYEESGGKTYKAEPSLGESLSPSTNSQTGNSSLDDSDDDTRLDPSNFFGNSLLDSLEFGLGEMSDSGEKVNISVSKVISDPEIHDVRLKMELIAPEKYEWVDSPQKKAFLHHNLVLYPYRKNGLERAQFQVDIRVNLAVDISKKSSESKILEPSETQEKEIVLTLESTPVRFSNAKIRRNDLEDFSWKLIDLDYSVLIDNLLRHIKAIDIS